MGFGGISIWQLLIILVIIILLFGTKKLRSLGGDLGSAIKSFKQSVREGEDSVENAANKETDSSISHADDNAEHKVSEEESHKS